MSLFARQSISQLTFSTLIFISTTALIPAKIQAQQPDSTANQIFKNHYKLPKYVPDPRKALADNMTSYLDAMGRAMVQHDDGEDQNTSWFYGAYALLQLENTDGTSDQPLGKLQDYVPGCWADLKYLTVDDLSRKVDAIMTHGVTVPLYRPERPFSKQTAEERLVNFFNGMRHLKMLRYTLGDSLFEVIVTQTDASGQNGQALTDTLIQQISSLYSPRLAYAFFKALQTADRTDPTLDSVQNSSNFVRIKMTQKGAWNFPVTLRLITKQADTLVFNQVWPDSESIVLPVPARVKQVILDPDKQLVEIDRYNNYWPRYPQAVMVQPFWGLPSWEYYKIVISPFSWRDWNDLKRYGVRVTGGIGIDLMPLYPSDYRHRWMVELSAYGDVDQPKQWGVRLDYGTPLSWRQRLFLGIKADLFKDFQKTELGLTKYVGISRYPFQGFRLEYHRFTGASGVVHYANRPVCGQPVTVPYLSLTTTRFMLTEAGHQLHYSGTILTGWDGNQPWGVPFTVYRGQISLGGVFGGWLRAGFSGVGGYERGAVPYPFEFTETRAWIHPMAKMPGLQGQATREDPAYAYLGTRVSLGYWFDLFQPKVFGSAMLYGDQQTPFDSAPLQKAVGIGFEHQSFFFLGVYFPFWRSHPTAGENQWAFRYQWKFGLYL